ncbi:CHASE2 domain-containing serine/threonine-protein kinase [Cylindrospermopsis raciborskii]|jgi:CHASE2 domain-containing sensor protein/tRNA A-37 threonylcarbamoyl transferase component Bud32|uniref:CHASE2 domain-containing serine/threonine-protein kinase n=1 Tax=Cylindrospermopsis raciborskii TaxID=77022 RepID=UPI000E1F17D9|nr:CHASE2 domain-containing serine/threonine-protein kinase [Cylindrospermopsis raciborskii]UJL33204.1 CHASE2 domain-containing protein [Cylindrospermopsis raciborskii Cr2010]UJS03555.1 CHASE2 domain-containing serine/threonine-protein kinase [Cylindrospermopsis raciborskii KLL07]
MIDQLIRKMRIASVANKVCTSKNTNRHIKKNLIARSKRDLHNFWSVILATSMGVTGVIWGVSEMKWLQSMELGIYDRMLRLRHREPIDRRLLLVTITEEDIKREKWPLSDQTVNQLMKKLASYQPRVVGLNIYRPQQKYKDLGNNVAGSGQVIATCLLSNIGRSEVPPPGNIPIDNIGFDDVVSDNQVDQVIRRGLLFAEPTEKDEKCQTEFSFGTLLAITYLDRQGIGYTFGQNQELQIGKAVFHRLDKNAGGYQHVDTNGYQILLNYRHPQDLAQQVTLTQVLKGKIKPSWIKDRLVIIGATASSVHPGYYTPYSSLSDQSPRLSRMMIHAQVASQIISTALDGRAVINYWSDWLEWLWIWSYAVIGAILTRKWHHPIPITIALIMVIGFSLAIVTILSWQAIWIPFIRPVLCLIISSIVVISYTNYQVQKQNQIILDQVQKQQQAIEEMSLLWEQKTQLPTHVDQFDFVDAVTSGDTDLLLAGRYQIMRNLASGGFGRTYLVEDTQNQNKDQHHTCVIKQLMPARRDDKFLQVARRLFNTEAEILAIVGQHPQIPQLLGYFEDRQEFYLVQEYIVGHTLSQELPPVTGAKSQSFVIAMLLEILEILSFIHQHHVIHRDIKPSNIMRRHQDNRLCLIDFGAVKLIQPQINPGTESATVSIGTRGYSPPEQLAGHPRLSSDIYALGMIGIQAITGNFPQELPLDPQTGNVVWRDLVNVSDHLADILDKMVCYNFGDRYFSTTSVIEDLSRNLF